MKIIIKTVLDAAEFILCIFIGALGFILLTSQFSVEPDTLLIALSCFMLWLSGTSLLNGGLFQTVKKIIKKFK